MTSAIYENEYRREHSEFLNSIFDIRPNGVDYFNLNNIGFEFKECYSDKHLWFKIPKEQIEPSDFFVFCLKTSKFYLVDKRDIAENFDCKGKGERANIRINTVKLLSIYEHENILIFKNYIDEIKEVHG